MWNRELWKELMVSRLPGKTAQKGGDRDTSMDDSDQDLESAEEGLM